MTRYLLRWQWVFVKRYLLTAQGIIPIAVNVLFQGILFASMFGSNKDLASNIVMVVAYASSFALAQTTTVYLQALAVTSSGLLGIAPIPSRPKIIMAMSEMLVMALLQSFVVALGIGILLSTRVSVIGGLWVWLLTFATGVCVYGGVATGLTALLTMVFPPKLRAVAPAFSGLLYFATLLLYTFANHRAPGVIEAIAGVFLHTARHPVGAGSGAAWFLIAALVGIAAGLVPMARSYGKTVLAPASIAQSSSKAYVPSVAPPGLVPLLLWRERIAAGRSRMLLIALAIAAVVIAILPQNLSSWVFVFLGVQLGSTVLSIALPKSIPLLYLAPVHPSRLWLGRVVSLVPATAVATVLFLVITVVRTPNLQVANVLCNLCVPFTGLVGTSFLVMINPGSFTAGQRRKQSIRGILSMTLVASVVPIGLAVLNMLAPWPGLVVDIGILGGVLHFGPTFLDNHLPVRYPFRDEA